MCMLQKGFRLQFAVEPDSIVIDTIKTPVFFMFLCGMERCLQGRVMCSVLGNGRSRYAGHTVLVVSPLTCQKRLTFSKGFHGLREAARTHFPPGTRVWGVADGLMKPPRKVSKVKVNSSGETASTPKDAFRRGFQKQKPQMPVWGQARFKALCSRC